MNGIIVLVPILLTVWIVTKVFSILDNLTGKLFDRVLNIPGMGIVLSLVIITIVGYLATTWLTKSLFTWADKFMSRIPGVKTLYNLIKDTLSSFVGEKRSFSKVAAVRIPGTEMKLLGFVTSEDCAHIGYPGYSSVYVMQSMQWAGNTILVPIEDIEIVNVSAEEAMKFIVSAGIASKKELDMKA